MRLLDKLKAVQFELNVCKVIVPDLGDEPQYVAELAGDEFDDFVMMWKAFRDTDETESNTDYKRAAVAFCWCDENRNRLVADQKEFVACIKQLRVLPHSITDTLFEPCNVLNGFLEVNPQAKKFLLAAIRSPKSVAGNGESP
jgi:hypothetical protein